MENATEHGQHHAEALDPSVLQKVNDPAVLESYKQRAIRIMSECLNDSLSELGYVPGMVQKLHQLSDENQLLVRANREINVQRSQLQQYNTQAASEIQALRADNERLKQMVQISASQASQAANQVVQVTRAAQARHISQHIPGYFAQNHFQNPSHMSAQPLLPNASAMVPSMTTSPPAQHAVRPRQASLPAIQTTGFYPQPPVIMARSGHPPTSHSSVSRTLTPRGSVPSSPATMYTSSPSQSPHLQTHPAQIPNNQMSPVHYSPHHRSYLEHQRQSSSSGMRPQHPLSRPPSTVIDLTGSEYDGAPRKRLREDADLPHESLSTPSPSLGVAPHAASLAGPVTHDVTVSPTLPADISPKSPSNATFASTPVVSSQELIGTKNVENSAHPVNASPGSIAIEIADNSTPSVSESPGTHTQVAKAPLIDTDITTQPEPMGVGQSAPSISQAVAVDEEGESADEMPDLDADGRFPIAWCLEQAFDDDPSDVSIVWCLMCKTRYDWLKSNDKACVVPTPFKRDNSASMVEHCEKEHPIGWEMLRTGQQS